MSIRSASKVIVLHKNKVLLNRNRKAALGEYYTLPGGGQHQYEPLEAAAIRECLEETGYAVIPEQFIALYEEIHLSETLREKYPDYTHRIFHIFRCSLADEPQQTPAEQDIWQQDCVWVDIAEASKIHLMPVCIRDHMEQLIHTETPLYLGSHTIDFKENV